MHALKFQKKNAKVGKPLYVYEESHHTMVGWLSGLKRWSRKPVGERSPRRFKSCTHRRTVYHSLTYTISMTELSQNYFFILFILMAAGFAVISRFLFIFAKKIKILYGETAQSEDDFQKDLIRRLAKTETKIEEMEPRVALVETLSRMSVQKVGFLRFNPFQDTGGDNSFVLALLDHQNNGVIISSLYTRGGMRVYGKAVTAGETKYPLSEEEKNVLMDTIRHNGI